MCLLVSGDNANTLKDMPAKGSREEKDAVAVAITTPTAVTTFSTGIELDYETAATTESFWKEDELTNESDLTSGQHANIRNTSDARGIFSNVLKTINRCKWKTIVLLSMIKLNGTR